MKSPNTEWNCLPLKRSMLPAYFFTFFILAATLTGFAAERSIRFEHLGIRDGLSLNGVLCIRQDSRGYLWIGTQEGLNRYDGYSFTVFKHDRENPNSLAGNFITSIAESPPGVLWIGTYEAGLDRYELSTGIFEHFNHDPGDPDSLSHSSVRCIYTGPSGMVWAGTQGGGVNRLDPKTGQITHYRHRKNDHRGLVSDFITTIAPAPGGDIWVGTRKGLNRLSPATGHVDRDYRDPGDPRFEEHSIILSLYTDKKGTLWAGTEDGRLYCLKPGERHLELCMQEVLAATGNPGVPIYSLFEDRSGAFWIGSWGGGAIRYVPGNGRVSVLKHDPRNPGSLNRDMVRCMFEDRTGIIWIGVMGGGLNKYVPSTAAFELYSHRLQDPNSLNNNHITCIYEGDANTLWVGTAQGLNRFDRRSGTYTLYKNEPGNPNSLSRNEIYCINKTPPGHLWIGTRGGLNRLDLRTGAFKVYKHDASDPDSISDDFISEILYAGAGTLWVGTARGGLNKMSMEAETFTRYPYEPETPGGISTRRTYSMTKGPGECLWLGTSEGLCRFTPSNEGFKTYSHQPGNPKGINNNKVMSVYAARDRSIWAGTWGSGLNRLSPDKSTFRHYTRKDGLLNEVINGILEDENGTMWVSTNGGLFSLEPGTGKVTHFDERDGLQGNEFNTGACHLGAGGRLYFGGVFGLNGFFPRNVRRNNHVPPVVLTDFQLSNDPVDRGPRLSGRPPELTHRDNAFIFEFAALDFSAPAKNRYAYKLEGLEKEWRYTGAQRRFVSYSNLSPGTYTFRVKGSNNHGLWNETGASIVLHIPPSFFQTHWFQLLWLLGGVLGIYLLFRYRIRAVEAQKQKLENIVTERTEDLRRKTGELEKINHIAKAINADVHFSALLDTLLRETPVFKSAEKAVALVCHQSTGVFLRFENQAAEPPPPGEQLPDPQEELEQKYIRGAAELFEDVYTCRDTAAGGRVHLVIRALVKKRTAGYLVISGMEEAELLQPHCLEFLKSLKGHIIGAFLRTRLLLDLKAAREAAEKERRGAEEASRSKSDFLARMSHEIRTPMSSVIGFTDILMDTSLTEEQLDYARTINRSGESLLSLVNDILDFSRVESGQLTLETIDFDPEVMAFDVCELMRPRIGRKPVEIICRIGEKVPSNVKGDPGRYRQVLINLMGNAVKFTPSGEIELLIEVQEEDKDRITLHAAVKDTGIGIPPDRLDNIFECFQQGGTSTSRQYGGSGLGLAICKELSRLMDGDVRLESTLGKGSTFHFTARLEKSGKKPVKPATPGSLTGKKVLVVDDNKNNLDILSQLLTSAGMEVVTLTRGADVLPMLHIGNKTRFPFQLCILDIQMPDMSGYDVARKIRGKDSPAPNLPLLAFTSSFSVRSKAFKESGFDGFLPKPIQRSRLIEVLEQLLGKPVEKTAAKEKKPLVTRHSVADDAKQSIRILLAEDNPINQKLANFILTKAGYHVDVAVNGKEAVDAVSKNPDKFDMIFMDVQMPEMNGIDAAKTLRKNGFKDIPIIAMTAQAMKGDREKCLAAGMDDYIPKPIKREMVYEMVRKWALKKQ